MRTYDVIEKVLRYPEKSNWGVVLICCQYMQFEPHIKIHQYVKDTATNHHHRAKTGAFQTIPADSW